MLYQPNTNVIKTGRFLIAIHGGPKKLKMYLLKLVSVKNSFTDCGGDSLHMGTTTVILKTVPPNQMLKPMTAHQRKKINNFLRRVITKWFTDYKFVIPLWKRITPFYLAGSLKIVFNFSASVFRKSDK